MPGEKREWLVLASFFTSARDRWLDDFIRQEDLAFTKLVPPKPVRDWHRGTQKLTPILTWLTHLRHARAAIRARPSGIITCFPQLALTTAVWKGLSRRAIPLIAYNFNLGELRTGLPQRLARSFAARIDRFVVHSPEEVQRYADYLGLSPDRFLFVPLQRGDISIDRQEDIATPFIVAMGSAHRDYPTLIRAVDRLGLRTVIVTREADIAALPSSAHVSYLSNLSEMQCLELMARARLCVTPVANLTTASGQVTFINAMHLGVPVIATRCPGTEGYIQDGHDGILVAPFDVDDMADAISRLWQDGALRNDLARNARVTARDRFSDEVAAERLVQIIRSLA
jgi:glycosyltransferase involved in cell wall biosynthesis